MSMSEFLRPVHDGKEPRFMYHTDGRAPQANQIFVFGSNLAGRHGAGAALFARRFRGAEPGISVGLTGRAYAIPTKSERINPLSLDIIRQHVERFVTFAGGHPELNFYVTRIGCGLAGYKDEQIAPMFIYAPSNCSFAKEWRLFLEH